MNANSYWKILLAIVAAGALWYTFTALSLWYGYIRLDGSIKAKSIEWSVKPLSEEMFHIQAHYSFDWNAKEFSGNTEFQNSSFRNAWAAEEEIKANKKLPWRVWFSVSHPEYSSLQKNFPIKECLSALALWGILIYFIGLKYYVKLSQR